MLYGQITNSNRESINTKTSRYKGDNPWTNHLWLKYKLCHTVFFHARAQLILSQVIINTLFSFSILNTINKNKFIYYKMLFYNSKIYYMSTQANNVCLLWLFPTHNFLLIKGYNWAYMLFQEQGVLALL